MPVNEQEARAIVEFFTHDSDKERFCGIGTDATVAQVEERFGAASSTGPALAIFDGREVQVTKFMRSGELVFGSTPYTCMVEVLVPASGFPQVDVRLRREGYVLSELKAAARELKSFFAKHYGARMRIERDGAARLLWIETTGVKQADERFQLTPCAVLRVQSSRR